MASVTEAAGTKVAASDDADRTERSTSSALGEGTDEGTEDDLVAPVPGEGA